jgi:hypothetical protein
MPRSLARPRIVGAFLALVFAAACAGPAVDARSGSGERTYSTSSTPMSVADIVLQLEAERLEEDIVAELFDRGLAAPASASDLTLLRRAGASPALLQAIYDAPIASGDRDGGVVILREPAFVPWVVQPWPHYRHYYPAPHYRPPHYHPRPYHPPPRAHPGPGRIDGPRHRPPSVRPPPSRPPASNTYRPREPRTPGMQPPGGGRAPLTKPPNPNRMGRPNPGG